jgi:hypothetical protein
MPRLQAMTQFHCVMLDKHFERMIVRLQRKWDASVLVEQLIFYLGR